MSEDIKLKIFPFFRCIGRHSIMKAREGTLLLSPGFLPRSRLEVERDSENARCLSEGQAGRGAGSPATRKRAYASRGMCPRPGTFIRLKDSKHHYPNLLWYLTIDCRILVSCWAIVWLIIIIIIIIIIMKVMYISLIKTSAHYVLYKADIKIIKDRVQARHSFTSKRSWYVGAQVLFKGNLFYPH